MARMHTVRGLARLAGVSVRMLHHYDAIGLLQPCERARNGYRLYGQSELLRLQQILILRELDMPLSEIAAALTRDGTDRIAALEAQRDRLAMRAGRLAGMLATIDATIKTLKGERPMSDKDLFRGLVSPEKQAEHEAWLANRLGSGVEADITASHKALAAMNAQERASHETRLGAVEADLARAMTEGAAADDPALDPLIARHRDWISASWGRECPPAAYAGLADVYEHPDFVARYEALAEGFADWLRTAMKAWAARTAA